MRYSSEYPSHQNAIDLLPGWVSEMPSGSGLRAGVAQHFNDKRPLWAADVIGGFANKSVLEIGPFEAYNSYQFEALGASNVLAIENSEKNFLRCLIVKNIFSMNTTFLYGDAISFMEESRQAFDICWLSGVLYHMTDPIRLLKSAARMADTMFVWTQYHDPAVINGEPGQAAFFDYSKNRRERLPDGRRVTLNYRSYQQDKGGAFSGGAEDYSYWMSKEDIFAALSSLGFTEIIMGIDNPLHPAGPACYFVAKGQAV